MNVRLIELPARNDARGELVFAEAERHIPFVIRRIFALFNFTAGRSRGAHAHKRLEQCLMALSGSFRVTLDDGQTRSTHLLDHPSTALYVGPLTWCEVVELSPNSTCLVLASDYFDESDYLRDYDDFLARVTP